MKPETIKDLQAHKHKDYALDTSEYRESWRIFRIMSELVEGYSLMAEVQREVTFLGSARTPEDQTEYQIARDLGKMLAEEGYSIVTGGGPGIMEAGNRGAVEGKGESVGLNIQLPFEQRVNPYVEKAMGFYYFFTRKVMLTSPAQAFVLFPGGFGTMDEFFEVVDHIELGKMCQVPIVLVGSEYWKGLIEFLRQSGEALGTVTEDQIQKWHIVDTAKEAFDIIHNNFGMKASCELSATNFHSEKNVDWRVFRVMSELVEGFEFLASGKEKSVSILGTKSIQPDNAYYASAHQLGQSLAAKGIPVVTGGASGIAEAANKGAFESGGISIGLGMKVHGKERMNTYVTRSMMFDFPFTRKLILTSPSRAFVFYPGGLGTLHQLFEILTLIQTGKLPKVPVILVDHAFWEPLHVFIKKIFVHGHETVSDEDDELYQIVDSVESVMKLI
jgi:uncharacterized protein (TIGR00730 family)